jgi:hypothetical protein
MRFERCMGWRVTFRDRDNDRSRFRELTFVHSEKIEHLVARTTTLMMLEDKHSFQAGLRSGLGAINLTITEEQYRKLLR